MEKAGRTAESALNDAVRDEAQLSMLELRAKDALIDDLALKLEQTRKKCGEDLDEARMSVVRLPQLENCLRNLERRGKATDAELLELEHRCELLERLAERKNAAVGQLLQIQRKQNSDFLVTFRAYSDSFLKLNQNLD